MFEATLDATDFDAWLRALGTEGARKAMSRTMKETLTKAKTMAARDVRDFYNVKYGETLKTLKTRMDGGLVGELRASNPMVPAMTYKLRPNTPQPATRPVVWTNILKDRSTQVPGAFIAQMPNGHVGLFKRTSKKRLHIKQIMSIYTAQQMLAQRTNEKVPKDVAAYYDERLAHNILFLSGQL